MGLDEASLIWNRALRLSSPRGDVAAGERGDRYLAVLLLAEGLWYNGGLDSMAHQLKNANIKAAADAARYFGLDEIDGEIGEGWRQLVSLFEDVAEGVYEDSIWVRADACGDTIRRADEDIEEALRRKLRDTPEDFSPVSNENADS